MRGLDLLQSNMVSPFSIHQQQLAMLAQQQSLLMAAAAKSVGGETKSNGTNVNIPNWPSVAYHGPGMVMPSTGQNELQELVQVFIIKLAPLCNASSL